MTSSKSRSASWASHRSRRPWRNPGSGGTTPMFAATGSTMTTAICPSRSAKTVDGGVEIVEGRGDGVASGALRHPRRGRDPQRGQAAARALRQQRVGVAVVAAGELHDQVTAREAARQAHGAHGCLRAAVDQPDLVDRWDRVHDALREVDLGLRGHAERRAAPRGPHRRRPPRSRDTRARTAAPPRLHEIHVAVPVDVDEVGALAAFGEDRRAADASERADGRVHTAGDQGLCAREEIFETGSRPGGAHACPIHSAASFAK